MIQNKHDDLSRTLTALSQELRREVAESSAAAAVASSGSEEVSRLFRLVSERVAVAESKAEAALTIDHTDRLADLEARMASSDNVITGLRSIVKNYEANE